MGLALMLAAALPSVAQELDVQNTPVLLQADELIYNEDLGVVTARGNVEMRQGDRLLMVDTDPYNQQADTVTASGNVSLMEPKGEARFPDYPALHDDLQTGHFECSRAPLTDDTRWAATRPLRPAPPPKVTDSGRG